MAPAGRDIDGGKVRVELVGVVDQRPDEAEQDHQHHKAHADDRQLVLSERSSNGGPWTSAADDLAAFGHQVDFDLRWAYCRKGWGVGPDERAVVALDGGFSI